MVRHLIQTSLARASYEKWAAGSLCRSSATLYGCERCFERGPVEDQRRRPGAMDRLGTDANDERTPFGRVSPNDISDDRVRKVEESNIAVATCAPSDVKAWKKDR